MEESRKQKQKQNQNQNQKQKRVGLILLILIIGLIGFPEACFADGENNDSVISDSISPLKFEMKYDENKTGEKESVFLTITNTGDVATNYICYFDQKSGKNDLKSVLEISEKQISLLPKETKKIEISISNENLKNTTTKEFQLKIIRNPETQTPVGYIIPIEINGKTNENGNETENKTGTGNKNQTNAEIKEKNDFENETKIPPQPGNENKAENNSNQNETNHMKNSDSEKKNELNIENFAKAGIVLGLGIAFLIFGWFVLTSRKIKKMKRK